VKDDQILLTQSDNRVIYIIIRSTLGTRMTSISNILLDGNVLLLSTPYCKGFSKRNNACNGTLGGTSKTVFNVTKAFELESKNESPHEGSFLLKI
jgi:hypothetical protein